MSAARGAHAEGAAGAPREDVGARRYLDRAGPRQSGRRDDRSPQAAVAGRRGRGGRDGSSTCVSTVKVAARAAKPGGEAKHVASAKVSTSLQIVMRVLSPRPDIRPATFPRADRAPSGGPAIRPSEGPRFEWLVPPSRATSPENVVDLGPLPSRRPLDRIPRGDVGGQSPGSAGAPCRWLVSMAAEEDGEEPK